MTDDQTPPAADAPPAPIEAKAPAPPEPTKPPTPPAPPGLTTSPSDAGGDSKPEDLITQANAAAIRLEEANKVTAALLEKQTALKVEQTLGGTAEAGSQDKSVEEKQRATARKYLEGTGLEDYAFPPEKDENIKFK